MSICKSKLNGTSGDIKKQLKMGQKLKYKLKLWKSEKTGLYLYDKFLEFLDMTQKNKWRKQK